MTSHLTLNIPTTGVIVLCVYIYIYIRKLYGMKIIHKILLSVDMYTSSQATGSFSEQFSKRYLIGVHTLVAC